MAIRLMLKDVRLSFPDLWAPRKVPGSEGDPKFGANFILPPHHPSVKELDAAIEAVATEKWQAKTKTMLPMLANQGRLCLHKLPRVSAAGEVYDGYEGMYWIAANSTVRPTVVGPLREPLTEADGRPYSGCYVNASIEVYAHSHPTGGNRVLAQLRGVQFVRDGDAFGGGRPASPDEFEELSVSGTDDLV